jgi:hypothetical protein
MPLLRYFMYVGGVLIALLFGVSALIPKAEPVVEHDATKPVIRIASARVAPPRVDFDTSVQAPVKPVAILPKQALPAPAPPREAMAQVIEPHAPPAVAPPAAAIKNEPKIEHRKTRVARRPDHRLVAAYPQPFFPFRWTW